MATKEKSAGEIRLDFSGYTMPLSKRELDDLFNDYLWDTVNDELRKLMQTPAFKAKISAALKAQLDAMNVDTVVKQAIKASVKRSFGG